GGSWWDYEFESPLLQRRVHCEPDFRGASDRTSPKTQITGPWSSTGSSDASAFTSQIVRRELAFACAWLNARQAHLFFGSSFQVILLRRPPPSTSKETMRHNSPGSSGTTRCCARPR